MSPGNPFLCRDQMVKGRGREAQKILPAWVMVLLWVLSSSSSLTGYLQWNYTRFGQVSRKQTCCICGTDPFHEAKSVKQWLEGKPLVHSKLLQWTAVAVLLSWCRQLLQKIPNVTTDDLQRVGCQYFACLFDPTRSKVAICCHPTKVDETVGELLSWWVIDVLYWHYTIDAW